MTYVATKLIIGLGFGDIHGPKALKVTGLGDIHGPLNLKGLVTSMAAKIFRFGEMHATKAYKVTGLGDTCGPKAYKFIGFGDIHGFLNCQGLVKYVDQWLHICKLVNFIGFGDTWQPRV